MKKSKLIQISIRVDEDKYNKAKRLYPMPELFRWLVDAVLNKELEFNVGKPVVNFKKTGDGCK